MRIFDGLMSLWITLAECINLSAHSKLYKIIVTCFSLRLLLGESSISFFRSVPNAVYTRNSDSMLLSFWPFGTMISRSCGVKK